MLEKLGIQTSQASSLFSRHAAGVDKDVAQEAIARVQLACELDFDVVAVRELGSRFRGELHDSLDTFGEGSLKFVPGPDTQGGFDTGLGSLQCFAGGLPDHPSGIPVVLGQPVKYKYGFVNEKITPELAQDAPVGELPPLANLGTMNITTEREVIARPGTLVTLERTISIGYCR